MVLISLDRWVKVSDAMRAAHTIDTRGIELNEGELGDIPWWSFTKLVIATAALRLVELGRIELDEPAPGADYTLRQLLQHEAGLPDYGQLRDYHAAVARGDRAWPPEEIISRTLRTHQPCPPGSRWAYSNIGYFYVGQIISASSGANLADTLQSLALGRAGSRTARLARSRSDLESVQMGSVQGYDPQWVLHGLLVGPIAEAATFLHRLLSGGVLGEPMLTEMLTGRLLPQFRNELWEQPAYGLGVMGACDVGVSPCGHTGGGPGSSIAVYGCRREEGVKVAASWRSSASTNEVEAAALKALSRLG